MDFLNGPSCTWRTDLSRRTMHFGGTYCCMPSKGRCKSGNDDGEAERPVVLKAPDMPAQFDWLIQRMVDRGVFCNERRPRYCIVNEYVGNQGISAHTENFSFSQPVVALSLLGRDKMRFHELAEAWDGSVRSGKAAKAPRTGKKADVDLPRRSLLVMKDDARWKWQHEIARTAKGRGVGWKRVSLTFRVKVE